MRCVTILTPLHLTSGRTWKCQKLSLGDVNDKKSWKVIEGHVKLEEGITQMLNSDFYSLLQKTD